MTDVAPPHSSRRFSLARVDQSEYLDSPGHNPAELRGNLSDLERVNRWLAGSWLTIQGIKTVDRYRSASDRRGITPLTILDVGTGGADIPVSLQAWCRRTGRAHRIVATDASAEILSQARLNGAPGVRLAVADGRRLPFADRTFDVSVCSLVLHHLGPDDAVACLEELSRVARWGVVINDLVRSWIGYAGALALAVFATRNRLTRHDMPLSVRRAYTVPEIDVLARRAGLIPLRYHQIPGYRVALAAVPR